jgi:hypothetical protein
MKELIDIMEEAARDAYYQEIGERLADELVLKTHQATAGKQRWNKKEDDLRERNQKIVEHFKKRLLKNKYLTKNTFANKHAADYGLKPRQVRAILSKMAVGS